MLIQLLEYCAQLLEFYRRNSVELISLTCSHRKLCIYLFRCIAALVLQSEQQQGTCHQTHSIIYTFIKFSFGHLVVTIPNITYVFNVLPLCVYYVLVYQQDACIIRYVIVCITFTCIWFAAAVICSPNHYTFIWLNSICNCMLCHTQHFCQL